MKFPKADITTHFYVDNGHYLIFRSRDNKSAVLFEEWDGKIQLIRAGLEPSVEYVEGCQ